MIQLEIHPTGVERIVFSSGSDLEDDLDLAAWQAVRNLVRRIVRRLCRHARSAIERGSHESQRGDVRA